MSSHLLWKAYYEDDLPAFQRYLLAAAYNTKRGGNTVIGSPLGSSPAQARRITPGSALGKVDINGRDATGQTLLHHAASSTAETAIGFVTALIDHPFIDVYLQDHENGWVRNVIG